MNNSKLKSRVCGVIASVALLCFITACNNSSESVNNSTDSTGTDTSMNNQPATPDTSSGRMSDTTMKKSTTTKKHKTRATVGAIVQGKSKMADKTGVYEFSEVRPAYPDGENALADYINNHVEYPQTAIDNNVQGTVNVQFTIDENGSVTDAKLVGNKLGNGIDEEAVRVVSSLPKWTPGKVKGKTVKSKVTLPITFKIEE